MYKRTGIGTLAVFTALAACTSNIENGQRFTAPTMVGQPLALSGFVDRPNTTVEIEILDSMQGFVGIGSTVSSETPLFVGGDPTPLYEWSISVVPVPTSTLLTRRWPFGGLGRLRAVEVLGSIRRVLYTFDELSCLNTNWTGSWSGTGVACQSHDNGTLTLIHAAILPGVLPSSSGDTWLNRRENSVSEASDYVTKLAGGAPPEALSDFKTRNGFGGADEITATYFNAADLGFGREMHCRQTSASAGSIACYVTNYGGFTGGILAPEVDALHDAVRGVDEFATVAMEFDGTSGANNVKFYVFDDAGSQLEFAALDSEGAKPVPGICLSCHGGRYDPATDTVTGAHFLPFDVSSFGFTTEPAFAHLARAPQEEAFRQLNALVARTPLTAAGADLIDGWYGGAVDVAGTPFFEDYVPSGWSSEAYVYQNVVRPYCRGCHVSIGGLEFGEFANLLAAGGRISTHVCTTRQMPHAELTYTKFWTSSARAHLSGALGLTAGCGN